VPRRKTSKSSTITIVIVAFVALSFISSLINPSEPNPTATGSVTAEQTQSAPAPQATDPTATESLEPSPEGSEAPSPGATPGDSDGSASSATPTSSPTTTPSPTPTRTTAAPANEPDAGNQEAANVYEQLLLSLTMAPEVTSGYDRDLFRHWIDADRNGCDARKEVLIQESLTQVGLGDRCKVETGSWLSVYDNQLITDSSKLDIDHMIPLKEAWDSGADQWTAAKRQAFANDLDLPQALIAVSAGSNRSKSARDPSDWLPTNQSYICQYIQDWMIVKVKWELSVDQREFNTLSNVATRCVN